MHERNSFTSKWLLANKYGLNSSGFQNVWQAQDTVPTGIAEMIKTKLIDAYKQKWFEAVFQSSKCLNYRIFKGREPSIKTKGSEKWPVFP